MYSLSLQCHLSVMVSPRGVSGVIMWFCYQLALDTSSLRLPSVKLGKVIPVSRVVRVCKCVSTLPTVPGTENVLNTCSYFFSYYNGGEIIEAWGEVTTKCELKQSIWNPFGNVWFHLYTIWFSCALASMRETVHGLGVILMVGIFGEGQDWDG